MVELVTLMKEPQEHSDSLIQTTLLCAVLLLAAGCATQGPIGNSVVPAAKVTHQKGVARCRTGSSDWQPLIVGDLVKPGTMIQTGTNSWLDLVLGYGMAGNRPVSAARSTVRLWKNTLLSVDKLAVTETGANVVTETQLDLKAGHIYGVVKKHSARSQYEVKLPKGVADIRGTVYDISAKGAVKVFAGSVLLAYTSSDAKAVRRVILGSPKFCALKLKPGAMQKLGAFTQVVNLRGSGRDWPIVDGPPDTKTRRLTSREAARADRPVRVPVGLTPEAGSRRWNRR